MTSIIGDVRDMEHLQAVIAQHKPEIIFHLAAQPLVRYSYVNPVETYATNVMGTVHLLEAVRQVDCVKVVVNITSDKCYENQEWLWGYRENEPLGGYDPYSNSKGCAELVTSAYRQSLDAKPVQWIVERLTQMWSNNASWKLDNKQYPHEAHYLKLDCAKAKTNLGWYPKWTLETALENIIYWYQAYEKQQDMQ